MKRNPVLPLAFIAAVGLGVVTIAAGCGSTPTRRHMVAGIAISEYSNPGTGNWSQTVITASGRSLTVSCGNPATQVRCSWDGPDPYLAGTGVLGSYEYVRSDGTASRPGSIRVIKKGAV